MPDGAAIIQGDRSILVEVAHPQYDDARDVLATCAELVKSPEHVHTYRITELSLWNARNVGHDAEGIVAGLHRISRFALPDHIAFEVRDILGRWGLCRLHAIEDDPTRLRLRAQDEHFTARLLAGKKPPEWVRPCPGGVTLPVERRGEIKLLALKLGYPVIDEAGLVDGRPFACGPRASLRPYPFQLASVEAFMAGGGHGVVVLPCGAGKTVVGLLAASRVGMRTLVVTSGTAAAEQWRREALARFEIAEADVVTYTSGAHRVAPITVTTYSMLASKGGSGPTKHTHFDRLSQEDFGLVIYDEVHLVPAPVFRLTAALQAKRRLGLTATLVREDGRERDVFALIGPKRFDVPWRELEASGHIAEGLCVEYRVALTDAHRDAYARADVREAPAVAASNPAKLDAVQALLQRHAGEPTLVIGSYLEPLERIARRFTLPLVTGATSAAERELLYERFRQGEVSTLVLSRVGNSSIDLPGASVMIQVSGSMGSRQEEAQRLGRILRPKEGAARFYTVVTKNTVEQDHALRRQMFLAEQGYQYSIEDATA